jgi:uncharacterized repeat protein (TIGR02059 family)
MNPMALTSQDIVLRLVTGMFGAAPGPHLTSLTSNLNSGGIQQLATTLGNSTFFQSLYPTDQDGYAFADAFLTHLLPGYTPTNAAHLAALNWLAGEFDSGVPPGQVALAALQKLYAVSPDDATWGAARTQWDQWTEIAARVAAGTGTSGSTLEELQDAMHAPVFASAEVEGSTLVLHHSDLNGLDAAHGPAATAFAVTVGGVARTVQTVAVDDEAATITLTLASTTFYGEAVTVAYTDPTADDDTNAIQDSVGNDALSLAATTVTNNNVDAPDTAGPVLAGATVDGATLLLTYIDANALDAANPPAPGDFVVKADGGTIAVSSVQVNPTAKTVILLLASAVTDAQEVTVAYHDPSGADDANAVQDTVGNDAATFAAHDVTNISPDTTAPEFDSATVDGDTLVMTYTDLNELNADFTARTSAFAVMVAGNPVAVDAVAVDTAESTVTLTLATAVTNAQAVTVAYTDPTGDDDARAIQDAAGNDAATLPATAVTNETADTTAPVFASATVTNSTLVMTYTEATTLDAGGTHVPLPAAFTVKVAGVTNVVTAVAVSAAGKTVTLTLTTAVTHGQAVTVAYADTTTGNDVRAIQDAAGNDAATKAATAVTNNTPDTTAPVFAGATVTATTLVMSYTEATTLDAANPPVMGDFAVTVDAVANVVTNVAVDANAKTVTLTLTDTVTTGSVALSYTDPTGGNDAAAIQDAAGNDVVSLVGVGVTIV